jgi:tripartite-type tricarboxylate transporter receptor subunit TctC
MVHVPFRGATAAIPDLLAGRIDVFIGAINSLLPLIKEGKLRAIAMAGKTRVPSLPDVPTIAELAFRDYELGSAVGLVAPARTPPDVVETLNREIGKIIATPGFRERMQKIGLDVVGSTPAAYAKFLNDDYNKWAKVVAAAGLTPQ